MKQLITIKIAILVFAILLLNSCRQEIFVPDNTDPRLPAYTEKGNQVGGALVNNIAWKTNFFTTIDMGWNRSFYFTNYTNSDSITLDLDGSFTEGQYKDIFLDFTFVLRNISLNKFEDIEMLNGQTFTLDGIENYVIIRDFEGILKDNVHFYYGGKGQLEFKTVKKVNYTWPRGNGERYYPLIVAGTFAFKFEKDSINVESGRFDFEINDDYLDQGLKNGR